MLPGSKPILELTVLQQTRLPPPMVDSPKFLMRSNRKIKFEIIEIFALDMHNIRLAIYKFAEICLPEYDFQVFRSG